MNASDAGVGDGGEPGFEMTLGPGAVQNENGFASQDREARYPAGNSSAAGAIANFVNTIVGAGIVGLPFALAQVGRLRFLAGLVGLLCYLCMYLYMHIYGGIDGCGGWGCGASCMSL